MTTQEYVCFHCGRLVNSATQPNVVVRIEHRHARGNWRKTRAFHASCFTKFEVEGGRPWNPSTEFQGAR